MHGFRKPPSPAALKARKVLKVNVDPNIACCTEVNASLIGTGDGLIKEINSQRDTDEFTGGKLQVCLLSLLQMVEGCDSCSTHLFLSYDFSFQCSKYCSIL